MEQSQFLEVLLPEEARRRWYAVLSLAPLSAEEVPLEQALGRVLAADVSAPGNVPAFHRSDVDGWALRAADTAGAAEDRPVVLRWDGTHLRAGQVPGADAVVRAGTVVAVETGGVVARGADAVIMVEDSQILQRPEADGDEPGDGGQGRVEVRRALVSGQHISFAGSDVVHGETVLWEGQRVTSRETAVLAAIGVASVPCVRRPRVAVLSTGNELIAPGQPLKEGEIHDVNARAVADAIREAGGEAFQLGIVGDDEAALTQRLREAVAQHDLVVLSGGTSKGHGDHSYRVIDGLGAPGVVVHGVALKPGKPLCLGAVGEVPVVVLPGFPVSALVTFHDFVAPVVRSLAGLGAAPSPEQIVVARAATRWHSVRGRRQYKTVHLVEGRDGEPRAYAIGKGSGSVTGFAHADGFVVIEPLVEQVREGEAVEVRILGTAGARELQQARTLDAIGSHCLGLDELLRRLRREGVRARVVNVGSTGGIEAVRRGEADVAGVHLLDADSGTYNAPFLTDVDAVLVRGYGRRQGVVLRADDPLMEVAGGQDTPSALLAALASRDSALMVNRNRGSGTRVLTDQLLGAAGFRQEARAAIPGYTLEARSHSAVAATVVHGKADWGVAIETVAKQHDLAFFFLASERFDFVVPGWRLERPVVKRFLELLRTPEVHQVLRDLGFEVDPETGGHSPGS